MKIFFKLVSTGESFACEVKDTDTIYSIKSQIKDDVEITPINQRFLFNGWDLEDDRTFASYSIENNSTLYVAFIKDKSDLLPVAVVDSEKKDMNIDEGINNNEVVISVQDFVGENFFKVDTMIPVKSFKAMVENQIKVPKNRQVLYHKKNLLEDNNTLDSYDIKENSQLWLLGDNLRIIIKMPQVEKEFCLCLYSFRTIGDIKKKIWKKMGIAEDKQTLLYSGKSLDDDQTLVACGIRNNSSVHACFGIKGGSQEQLKVFIHNKQTLVTFELMVEKWYSIMNVKIAIESLTGITTGIQELTYVQEKLQDWKTLNHYEIENSSILHLCVDSHTIQIFIKTPIVREDDHNVIMLEVKNTITIDELMVKISQENTRGIPGPYCLFFDETELLMNNLTLAHYGIVSGTLLRLERSIQVHVGIPSGGVITVDLRPTDEIYAVKSKIEDLCGIPWGLQTLTYLKDEVDEINSLEDYELELGSLWELRWEIGGKSWSFFWPTYGV